MTRPLLPAAALALALSLTGCGEDASEGSAPAADVPSAGATTAPAAPSPSMPLPPTGSPAPLAPTPPVPGPTPSADGTSTPGARATGRSAAAAPSPATPSPAAADLATRAGRYTYDSRGTVTAGGAPREHTGTSTLTVDPPVRGTQTLVLDGDQGRTETDTVLRADGRYVSRLLLTSPAFSKEFRPAPAALLLPTPAEVGRTWSFTARSTDGRTTVTARNRVLRAQDVTVGGTRVPTQVIETRLTLRGDVTFDGTTTTHYATRERLAVRERGTGSGTVGGVAFSTDTSSTLRSVQPQ